MKIVIKATNFKLTPKIKKYLEEKLGDLAKFAKIFQEREKYFNGFFSKGRPKTEIWVEIGKTTLHHQKGKIFRTEAQVRFPGKSLRAEAERKNIYSAINEVKDELEREFKKYRERQKALAERGARRFKEEVKISKSARFFRKSRIRQEAI